MYKWQRRLWIAGVGLGTTLLIAVGVLIGAFRVAVQLVPEYRADVEKQVAGLFDTPVQIQSMDLIWRGRYPTLQLHQVALGDSGEGLQFDELRIGFSVFRLLHGDVTPRRLSLRGTAMQLTLEDQRVQLAGINSQGDAQPAPEEVLEQLYQIGDIELLDATLLWVDLDHQRPPRELHLEQVKTRRGLRQRLELNANAEVIGQGRVQIQLALRRGPWRLERVALDLGGLDVWDDLHAMLPDMPALHGHIEDLHLDSDWRDGQWDSVQFAFDLRDFGVANAEGGFERWRGDLVLRNAHPGVEAELQVAELVAGSGRWPDHFINAKWQPGQDNWGQLSLNLDMVRLGDFAPWFGLLPENIRKTLTQLQPAGELHDVRLQAQAGAAWPQLTAKLVDVQLNANGAQPGIRGFSGVLSLDENQGRLTVDSQDLILDMPAVFAQPLPLDELSGTLSWQRSAAGWQVSAPVLHYAAMGLDGVGRLGLNFAESQQIDLELNFFCPDPKPWLEYQPKTWGKGLHTWLSGAVEHAKLGSGQVQIRGDLAEFPFENSDNGVFRVALELQDLGLKFASDWPVLNADSAGLVIEGRSLSVQAFGNEIGGLSAASAQASIDDLRAAELSVAARVNGDASQVWRMLKASNLRESLQGALDNLDVSGPLDGELLLNLPLKDLSATDYEVKARLDKAALWTRFWPDPIQKIRGEILINKEGLRSHDLTARLAGIPVQARMLPKDGLTRIEAKLELPLERLPKSVPLGEWFRSRASGSTSLRFAMEVGAGAKSRISLESNMLGAALDFPTPLGKTEDELRRLTLSIEPSEQTHLHVAYAQLLGFDAVLAEGAGLEAARLHFGSDVMSASAPGWWVDGSLVQANLDEWLPVIQDLAAEASDAEGGMPFGQVNVDVTELQALGQRFPNTNLQVQREDLHWKLSLAGSRLTGDMFIPHEQEPERFRLRAELQNLNWALDPGSQREPVDPRLVPQIQLTVGEFSLNNVPLGQLALDLAPLEQGIRIQQFSIFDAGRKEVDVGGMWLQEAGGESANLEFAVETESFSSWLTALGYQDNIVAKKGQIDGQLKWAPSPQGLNYTALSGGLSFNFTNGQLVNVEPGAGRVLGLFSVNALPRRFFLDFSDVVETGLGFDSLSGEFLIKHGVAETQNFELLGPSLRIVAAGSVDLAQKLYDQTITIYPGVSSGVSLAATLLGGPVVGILTVLAQELLDKPLDQVSQISYKLGGSWDNPQVSRVQ